LVLAKLMGVAALISAPPANGKRPQAIRRDAPAPSEPAIDGMELQQFHEDEPSLQRPSRIRSALPG
jgi:hypothetical protein